MILYFFKKRKLIFFMKKKYRTHILVVSSIQELIEGLSLFVKSYFSDEFIS